MSSHGRRLTVIDEIEIIMRQRLWSPWYERYGPDFRHEMWRYPIEQTEPPELFVPEKEAEGSM